jgi:mannose/fructose/N-acetylgalactosamine-specific phosphotransferase system component IID
MNTGVVSMRYAKALLAYADAQGKEDQVYEEVKTLADHYVTVPGLRRAVENPVLDIETKLQLLQEAAGGKDVSEELIVNTKNALMGPFAGIGDSMLVGTYSPILLSIAMSMCINDGNPVGPLFFCAVWLTTIVGLQWYLFHKGYDMGIGAANLFFTNKALADRITTGLTMMGLVVIGGVAATTVKAKVIYQFVSGDMTLGIQEQIFDKIMPGVLPLMVTLAVWYLMDKKKWSATKIILAIVVFSAIMVFLGIM